MPVNYKPDKERFISDLDTIGHFAKNELDRRLALDHALNNKWANKNIGCLERRENSVRWGWSMWEYRSGTTGPPEPPSSSR